MTDVIKEIEQLAEEIVNKRIELTSLYEDVPESPYKYMHEETRENLMKKMDFLTSAEEALENAKDALKAYEAEVMTW